MVKTMKRALAMFASIVVVVSSRIKIDMDQMQHTLLGDDSKPSPWVIQPTPEELAMVPPFFSEILVELAELQSQFGGTRNFDCAPMIMRKLKREDLASTYTDYEYIYLTILGFANLHTIAEEVVRKNNGKVFTQNPGVQLLECACGMTMHGDREGANSLLRSAPASLLEAFAIGKKLGAMKEFFRDAFDRKADPCLEGRVRRLMEYLETRRVAAEADADGTPPWEDVSLKPLAPGTPVRDVIGEHLRVFTGECIWSWSRQLGISYQAAKMARSEPIHEAGFSNLFNAATFEAALLSKGVASKLAAGGARQWEASAFGGSWNPYDDDVNAQIEQGLARGLTIIEVRSGPKGWKYEIDFAQMVQRNPKTFKERRLRCVERSAAAGAKGIPLQDAQREIEYYVEMCTLPAASLYPSSLASPSFGSSAPGSAPNNSMDNFSLTSGLSFS